MALEAVAFLERHQDEPFFLNYWMFSVHAPFDAKASLIEKYRRVFFRCITCRDGNSMVD